MSYEAELNEAIRVIHLAGQEILARYARFERMQDAPANISTEADRASQEVILTELGKAFPNDGLLGEERTPDLERAVGPGGRLWIIDPIDGSRGFVTKNGEFSIMIGLAVAGEVVLGAVYEPALLRLTYATRGEGCYVRYPFASLSDAVPPVRCHVSDTSPLSLATLSMSRSQGISGEEKMLAAFGAMKAVQTYSAGIKLAQVARGETDMYLGDYLHLCEWDVCAGHILVEEAGGRVTDLAGQPIRYGREGSELPNGILSTNGRLHDAAVAILSTGVVEVT